MNLMKLLGETKSILKTIISALRDDTKLQSKNCVCGGKLPWLLKHILNTHNYWQCSWPTSTTAFLHCLANKHSSSQIMYVVYWNWELIICVVELRYTFFCLDINPDKIHVRNRLISITRIHHLYMYTYVYMYMHVKCIDCKLSIAIEDVRTKSTQVQFVKISSSIFTTKTSLFKFYISGWFLHDWMCKYIEPKFMKVFWINSFTFAGFEGFSEVGVKFCKCHIRTFVFTTSI